MSDSQNSTPSNPETILDYNPNTNQVTVVCHPDVISDILVGLSIANDTLTLGTVPPVYHEMDREQKIEVRKAICATGKMFSALKGYIDEEIAKSQAPKNIIQIDDLHGRRN